MTWRVTTIAILILALGVAGLWWWMGRPPVETDARDEPPPPALAEVQELAGDVEGVEVRESDEGVVVEFRDVLFDFDRATIRPDGETVLGRLSGFLDDRPSWSLRLEGHTDDVGTPAYNRDLSEARVRAVGDFLKARGIGAERMKLWSFGETRPVASNETPEGRQRNRRVEITLLEPRDGD